MVALFDAVMFLNVYRDSLYGNLKVVSIQGVLQSLDPKGPMCPNSVYSRPPNTFLGTTLRPKYILFGYMDPHRVSKP